MRWRQVYDEQTKKSEFVPIDEAAKKQSGAAVHGDIDTFRSPVDGSIISDRKQLREHNERNNVVNQAEFGTEHYARKKKEREDLHEGVRSKQQIHADRREIYEIMVRAERG